MQRVLILFLVGSFVVVSVSCGGKGTVTKSVVKRGKYLVVFGGCNDCHSPKVPGPGGVPVPDANRLLSGHPENFPYPV